VRGAPTIRPCGTSYGVVWREGASLARGKLELLPLAIRLEGLAGATAVCRELAYADLEAVRVGRTSADRVNGQPTLVLEPHDGEPIVLAAVAQTGVVAELSERLTQLTAS
jgi:hypothetical protein